MKSNLSSIFIALCSAVILTVSACGLQQKPAQSLVVIQSDQADTQAQATEKVTKQSTPQTKTQVKTQTKMQAKKIDLSKYRDQSKICQEVTEKEVLACQKQGGLLKKQGMAQCYFCTIEYADAGKACSSSSDCQGACLNYKGNFVPADKINQKGQCAKDNLSFGCYQIIEKGISKHPICVD